MTYSRLPWLGVLVVMPVALALPALAQTATPTDVAPSRKANVWDGRRHPPRVGVQRDEQAAGVSTSAGQQRQQDDEVERLGQEILQGAQSGVAVGATGEPAR